MVRRPHFLATTFSLSLAALAAAQTADDPPRAPETAPATATAIAQVDSGAGGAPEGGDSTTVRLPPVVVTARKWVEPTRDVPQSITVIPGSLVRDAGLRDIRDAALFVPNLYFTEFTARRLSFPFVRGIGSGQGDPAVTTYIDGVPQLTVGTTNHPLFDVERIEFLRGPQGTLYGRNSIGGLIHVITKPPADTAEFRGDFTSGNFDLRETRLSYSTPLVTDRLSLSIGGVYQERDGYTENDFTGNDVDDRNTLFGRGQLLWTPDDQNEFRFSFSGERTRDGGFVLSDLTGLRNRPRHINQDFEGETERDTLMPALTWNYRGSTVDFTSVSAYQRLDLVETADFDFSALDGVRRRTTESLDAYTQEFRLSSAEDAPLVLGDGSELKWIVGLLYFTADSDRAAANEFRPGGVGIISPVAGIDADSGDFDDDGVGVFGQVTWTLEEKLDLGAGVRYDYESKEGDIVHSFQTGGFTMAQRERVDESYDEFVPRFSATYRWSDAITTYALAAKGFNAGGFNLSAPAGQTAYKPETSWTYEGGVKTTFFDDRLQLNAAYFYIDWDDMQLSQFDAIAGGFVTNAGESSSQGVEVELTARPAEGFDIFATFGYTDTEFDSFVDQFGADASGNNLPFAPETTWGAGIQYSGSLSGSTSFYLRGEYQGLGTFYYDAGNRESERFELANFRAGIGGTNWRVEGWIRNAFDRDYVPVAFQPNPADPRPFVGESGAPQTYGVTVSLNF